MADIVKIQFVKSFANLEVEKGSNLFKTLQNKGIPIASSCGGDGVCVKCRVKVIEGLQNLSSESTLEKDLKEIHDIPKGERISCQTQVLGNIVIDTNYW